MNEYKKSPEIQIASETSDRLQLEAEVAFSRMVSLDQIRINVGDQSLIVSGELGPICGQLKPDGKVPIKVESKEIVIRSADNEPVSEEITRSIKNSIVESWSNFYKSHLIEHAGKVKELLRDVLNKSGGYHPNLQISFFSEYGTIQLSLEYKVPEKDELVAKFTLKNQFISNEDLVAQAQAHQQSNAKLIHVAELEIDVNRSIYFGYSVVDALNGVKRFKIGLSENDIIEATPEALKVLLRALKAQRVLQTWDNVRTAQPANSQSNKNYISIDESNIDAVRMTPQVVDLRITEIEKLLNDMSDSTSPALFSGSLGRHMFSVTLTSEEGNPHVFEVSDISGGVEADQTPQLILAVIQSLENPLQAT